MPRHTHPPSPRVVCPYCRREVPEYHVCHALRPEMMVKLEVPR